MVNVAMRFTHQGQRSTNCLLSDKAFQGFLVIAVIGGLLGFGVIASAAAGIAKILFFIFLFIMGHASRGRTVSGHTKEFQTYLLPWFTHHLRKTLNMTRSARSNVFGRSS